MTAIARRIFGLALLAVAVAVMPAKSAEKVRAAKSVPQAFSFTPLEIGVQTGIFGKNGLDVELTAFQGDARMQQAAAAGAIDILVGSGPAMAFIAKGAPIMGIAAMAGPPLLMCMVARPDGPKSAADLKGKKVGVSTAGSLTFWLVSRTADLQGWGPQGITAQPMGAMPGQIAALKRGDIDAIVMDLATAFTLEEKNEARIIVRFDTLKDFHNHVIFATNPYIAQKPDVVRSFLKGWFETIAFMRKNKEPTVKIAAAATQISEPIISRTYDEVMPMFSDTGKFEPKALDTLRKSFVELGVLPSEPDMSKLYTEAFLPK